MVSAVSQMKIKLLRFVVVVVVVVRLLCWQLLNRRYLVAGAIAGDIKCQTVCKMENHDVMIGVRYSSIGNGNSNSTINTTEKKLFQINKRKLHVNQKHDLGDSIAYAKQMYRRFCVNICSIFRLRSHHIQISAGTEIPHCCYIMRESAPQHCESRVLHANWAQSTEDR